MEAEFVNVHQLVSENVENLCSPELYIDSDELTESVVRDYIVKYGEVEISDDEFWNLFKPYELDQE